MIQKATQLSPQIRFHVDDMSRLSQNDSAFAGIAAFYAIVHFALEELEQVFRELRRVLKSGGLFLLSFHVGSEIKHLDEFLGKPVSLDFVFFEPEDVMRSLRRAGFNIEDIMIRFPYDDVEYPSKRCYIFARK